MRRIKESHPDYKELNRLNNDLAVAINPHVHFNTKDPDIPKEEQIVVRGEIRGRIAEMLEGGVFRDFINR